MINGNKRSTSLVLFLNGYCHRSLYNYLENSGIFDCLIKQGPLHYQLRPAPPPPDDPPPPPRGPPPPPPPRERIARRKYDNVPPKKVKSRIITPTTIMIMIHVGIEDPCGC